jgi:hypothetical protein
MNFERWLLDHLTLNWLSPRQTGQRGNMGIPEPSVVNMERADVGMPHTGQTQLGMPTLQRSTTMKPSVLRSFSRAVVSVSTAIRPVYVIVAKALICNERSG